VNVDNNTGTLVDTSYSGTFTLAPGTYTPAEMITELTAKLNDSPSTYTYTVVYSAPSLSFAILNNSAASNPFTITFATAGVRKDTLGTVLGFPVGARTSQTHTPAAGNRLQGTLSELGGTNFLFLNSNAIGNEVNLFLPKGSAQFGNGGPQMAMVPAVGPAVFGDDIHYVDPCPEYWFHVGDVESLTLLDLFVTDGASQEVTKFNGRSFSVKIGMMLADSSVQYPSTVTVDHLIVGQKRRLGQ
jgi:hypothetical protein